jgi:hypothetical protein
MADGGTTSNKGGAASAASSSTTTTASKGAANTVYRYVRKDCHPYGPNDVFKIGKATVKAGAASEMGLYTRPWRFLVVCAGPELAPLPLIKMNDEARALMPASFVNRANVPWVSLCWTDGGVPVLEREDWESLVAVISEIDGDVGVYCMGGHGRTGTALSILGALSGAIPEKADPVQWVRTRYCRCAVEWDSQLDYVERMTGRKCFSSGSMEGSSYYYHNDPHDYVINHVGGKDIAKPASGAVNGAQSSLPLASAGGKVGTPVTNAAGDVIGYEYGDNPPEAQAWACDHCGSADVFESQVNPGFLYCSDCKAYTPLFEHETHGPWDNWGRDTATKGT